MLRSEKLGVRVRRSKLIEMTLRRLFDVHNQKCFRPSCLKMVESRRQICQLVDFQQTTIVRSNAFGAQGTMLSLCLLWSITRPDILHYSVLHGGDPL